MLGCSLLVPATPQVHAGCRPLLASRPPGLALYLVARARTRLLPKEQSCQKSGVLLSETICPLEWTLRPRAPEPSTVL